MISNPSLSCSAVMHSGGAVCATTQELVESDSFARVLDLYVERLESHNPDMLAELGLPDRARLLDLLRLLANNPLERVSLATAAPQTQFLAINLPGIQPGGNVSVLGGEATRIDQVAFNLHTGQRTVEVEA